MEPGLAWADAGLAISKWFARGCADLDWTVTEVVSRSKTGRGKVTAPIFLLVPQVKLPKRLNLDRDAELALDSVPGLIVANWVEGRLST
ncbi:hypothetical protein SAMN05444004_1304 [Jannaschia faecimaris]|uniref:Uncharacterized protein n=1 Tax=Jannaschia faecimaris TaxID=1244108 RepID=A0A1H3UD15_9RHOB|nr:hypothetical protein SAMN05444004_1304 [Jannaschia faecimaris]